MYIAWFSFLKLSFFAAPQIPLGYRFGEKNPKPHVVYVHSLLFNQSACYQWSHALLKYFMRSLHYMLTLPSLCCLIVHFHLDLVSNLDRLEMCKLLADI